MKKFLVLAALALALSSFAVAQATTPVKGDFGIGAAVSSTNNTINIFYNLSDSLVLAPWVGFFNTNYADTPNGGSTTNYASTWWDIGAGVFYVIRPFESLSVQIGPEVEFASEGYQKDTVVDKYQLTYFSVGATLKLLAMITKNFGAFTTIGAYYYSKDTNDTTTSYDSLLTGFGLQSVSLGAAYYFK